MAGILSSRNKATDFGNLAGYKKRHPPLRTVKYPWPQAMFVVEPLNRTLTQVEISTRYYFEPLQQPKVFHKRIFRCVLELVDLQLELNTASS